MGERRRLGTGKRDKTRQGHFVLGSFEVINPGNDQRRVNQSVTLCDCSLLFHSPPSETRQRRDRLRTTVYRWLTDIKDSIPVREIPKSRVTPLYCDITGELSSRYFSHGSKGDSDRNPRRFRVETRHFE